MKKPALKIFLAELFTFLTFLFIFAKLWAFVRFGKLDFYTVIYTLLTPMGAANPEPIIDFIYRALLPAAGLSVIALVIYILIAKASAKCSDGKPFILKFLGKAGVVITALSFVISLFSFAQQFDFVGYVKGRLSYSQLFETYYVDPAEVTFRFPETKRNLIYIFLESMEQSYASVEEGGQFEESLIPELIRLSRDNITFDGGDPDYAGAYVTAKACWTTAALAAQTSGLPLHIPLLKGEDTFAQMLPGATTIGDILSQNGYKNMLMIGSEVSYGGRDTYFKEHGDYQIFDLMTARERGLIPPDYFEFWGFEDQKLFEYAKEELGFLSASDQPFNLTLLTVDTHYHDGYACPLCPDSGDSQYANCMSCSSKQVYDFIEWCSKQDFYHDTTIVVAGDHNTMRGDFVSEDAVHDRKVFYTIINPAIEYANIRPRTITTFDLFPTTLSAMGIRYDSRRLGLGTDLFSGEPTLIELLGLEELNRSLLAKNRLYNQTIQPQ